MVVFSSPSGDGLVPNNRCVCRYDRCGFRPRVGMGWFHIKNQRGSEKYIFVPEWGWVGSADFNRNFKKSSNTI